MHTLWKVLKELFSGYPAVTVDRLTPAGWEATCVRVQHGARRVYFEMKGSLVYETGELIADLSDPNSLDKLRDFVLKSNRSRFVSGT